MSLVAVFVSFVVLQLIGIASVMVAFALYKLLYVKIMPSEAQKRTRTYLGDIPLGAKVTYNTYTGRKCKRCGVGKIVTRKRFKVIKIDNWKTLGVLAGAHWCDNCNYRNVSLENDNI